jgi:hypothetical protein
MKPIKEEVKPKPRPKMPSYETLPMIPKNSGPIKPKVNTKVVDYTLQAAKTKLMTSLSWNCANSVSELKDKYEQVYKGFRSR